LSWNNQCQKAGSNDTDLIGLHARSGQVLDLRACLENEGKSLLNPGLDWNDFMFLKHGQGFKGEQYQIPDQSFFILMWYRYDLFKDPKYKKLFADTYGKIPLLKYAPAVCKNRPLSKVNFYPIKSRVKSQFCKRSNIGRYDFAEMMPSSNAVMSWYFCTTFISNFSGFISDC